MPSVIGPCTRSWGTVGGTTCPTNGCTVKLAQDMLSAQSVIANSGYTLGYIPQDDPAHQVVSIRDNPGWRRPVGQPRKSWLGQIDQTCCEELEMGLVPAWRLATGDPHGWKQRLDAAVRSCRR